MTAIDGVQLVTLVVCGLTVPVWLAVARINPRVAYLVGVVIYPALIVMAFYSVTLFTDLPAQSPSMFQLLSALIRLYERGVMLVGGAMMWRAYRRRNV